MKGAATKALLILLFCSICPSQEIDVESLFEGVEEIEDQVALVDYLETLLLQPLDVNKASVAQLASLPWISSTTAVRVVQRRLQKGMFTSLDQVEKLFGSPADFENARHFLTVKLPVSSLISVKGRHRVSRRLEEQRGYIEEKYKGSQDKVLNSVRGSIGSRLDFGFVAEKDAGEERINDLTLASLQFKSPKFEADIIAGHFSAEFGQGLVLWGPYRLNKGSNPLAPAKQRGRALYPYFSTAENHAFKGIALSKAVGGWNAYAFVSRTAQDANVDSGQVISRPLSGLHRTDSEIAIRDQLVESVYGGVLERRFFSNSKIGVSYKYSEFHIPIIKKNGVDAFDFSGSSNSVAGVNFDVVRANLSMFGEVASTSDGTAAIAGGTAELEKLHVVLCWRHYDVNFQNHHALSFGEKKTAQNETGVYMGLSWRIHSAVTAALYSDVYRFPWPQNFMPMPASGHDSFARLEFKSSSLFKMQVQVRSEEKTAAFNDIDQFGNTKKILGSSRRSSVRVQGDILPTRSIKLRSRIEFAFFDQKPKPVKDSPVGFLLYQDVSFKIMQNFQCRCRWSFFDAPLYDVRLYQFENDLPGAMRIKQLSGRGSRWYGILQYKWRKYVQWTVKFEHSHYDDRDVIGSSYDEIAGADENIISMQMDWRF